MCAATCRYQVEKRYYRKDGQLLWGRFTATTIKDVAGQQACVIGMLEDITERKRAEEELQKRAEELERLNTELERSNRELDAFAYIASHDLKEPLRGIHHFSQFLLEDYADKLDADGVERLHTLTAAGAAHAGADRIPVALLACRSRRTWPAGG